MSIELLTDLTLPDIQLPVEVILGRPEKGCPGHGICRLERCDQRRKEAGTCHGRPLLNADLEYYVGKRIVRLCFATHELTSALDGKMSNQNIFSMEKPHFLSAILREACGLSVGAYLPEGHFDIQRRPGGLWVDFPVRGKLGLAELEIRRTIRQGHRLPRYLATFAAGVLVGVQDFGSLSQQPQTLLTVGVSQENSGRVMLHFYTGQLSARARETYFPKSSLHIAQPIQLGDDDFPTCILPGKYPVLSLPGQQLASLPLAAGIRRASVVEIQQH